MKFKQYSGTWYVHWSPYEFKTKDYFTDRSHTGIVRFYLYSNKNKNPRSTFSGFQCYSKCTHGTKFPQKNQETPNKQGHNSDVKPETSFKKLVEPCHMNDPDQLTVSTADCDRK